MFRIATFAHLAGVSAKMLRAWDAFGLFRPAWVDRSTGYRLYAPAQLPEIRRLLALRDLGVPLEDIRALAGGGADLRAVLVRRRAEIEAARREAERRLAALDIRVALDEAADPGLDVVIHTLPAELVAVALVPPDTDDSEVFYLVEALVRDLGVRADRPPWTLVADSERVAIPVTKRFPAHGGVAVAELPAVRVASVLVRGSYEGIGPVFAALRAWTARAGLVATDRRRIRYLQFGAERELRVPPAYVVGSAADFLTELQVELR